MIPGSALKTGIFVVPRSEIVSQQYNFSRDAIEVAEIKTITKPEVLAFYDKFISAGSSGDNLITEKNDDSLSTLIRFSNI